MNHAFGNSTFPQCAARIEVAAITMYKRLQDEYDTDAPRNIPSASFAGTENQFRTPSRQLGGTVMLPWRPMGYIYHSITQLPDGRLSMIVAPRT